MSDFICQKYTDCSSCSHYQKQIFKYRSFPKGMMIPKERCSQNTIYFLISGSVRVTSDEHPDTVFHDGQFIMQPIGSRVEFHILESTECILLRLFINGLKMYLNNELLCVEFLKAKQTELYFLLNCYYTLKEIAYFYAPIYRYSQTFRYFVMQNYLKAKDVESFAQLGGYSTTTFRRLFKDTFGEPAYQWMTKKKCLDIQNDLITTNASISEICYKYGFESLSNFSHFCRANFGKSPRAIRNERDENV